MNNKEWPQKKLGNVATLQRGFDLPKTQRQKGSCPVVSSGGISGFHNECKVKAPGVVTGRYGSVGEVFYVEQNFWPLNTTLWVKNFHGNDEKFIYYLLLSFNFKRFSDKTGVPGVNRNDLHKVKVVCPPLTQQKVIVSTISTWDSAIEKTERLIEAKEKVKKGLMQKLLTGKKRLRGYTDAWLSHHLGDIFNERAETSNGHLSLLSITREEGVIPRGDVNRKDTSNKDKSRYIRICPGDIGYNTMRMWQGVAGLSSLEGIVSPAYTIVTPKDGIDGEFMAYLFKLPKTIHLFYRYSQGLTSDTWNLKFHHFKDIKVKIPRIKEQKAITKILKTADEELNLLRIKLETFKKQKRGLMQKLLTGQWRVMVGEEKSQ